MDVPGIVQSELDGEEVAASVSLGGEDALYVTPTRTLIYRSESLLSDESVETYPHDAERVTVKDGRRKTRITLTYSLDGERDFTIPSSVSDDVLHPVLAGVLNGSGITDPGETVVQTFRFSELTLIVTSDRLLKHVGSAVWDDDHEQYHFDDVTGLDFEEGSVATQIVLDVDGRPQRIKTPNEHIAVVRERLTQALFAYYEVDSHDAFDALVDPQEDAPESSGSPVDFGEGVDPLGSSSGSRPADTSGDPFHDDEKAESLVDDDTATRSDATTDAAVDASADSDATGPDGTDRDPRRPVSGDADATDDRRARRAEPADASPDATDATGSASGDATRTDAADAAGADAVDANGASGAGGVDDEHVSTPGVESATTPGEERDRASTDASATDDAVEDAADAGDDDAGEFAAAGWKPATEAGVTPEDLMARIDSLEERVDAQNALLEQQQALVQQLIQELRER